MRRSLVVVAVAAMLAGCAAREGVRTPPPPHPSDGSWPALPATVAVDEPAPALPPAGVLGRGALLLGPNLVLEDGRQFRLPDGPDGEWWGRKNLATLSPDGRWLGLRTATRAGEQSYQLRSLVTGATVAATGAPWVWSLDSRWLLLYAQHLRFLDVPAQEVPDSDRWTVLDLSSGESRPVPPESIGATAILPNGDPLHVWTDGTYVELVDSAGDSTRITFRDVGPCWCPTPGTPVVVSPDGQRISVILAANEPGPVWTGPEPSAPANWPPRRAFTFAVAVFDRATVEELRRQTFELPDNLDSLEPVADRGADVLVRVTDHETGDQLLMALDPVTGTQTVVTTAPYGPALLAPGQTSGPLDPGGYPV